MARSRSLKPGFFTNEQLADLPPLTRLLFQGLWIHADRVGRLEDRPRKLKAEILPYDDCDVDSMLRELADAGFIQRYSIDSRAYICLPTFTKHQNPHPKEPISVIPEPQPSNLITRLDHVITRLVPENKLLEMPLPNTPIPNIPIPHTPTPVPARAFSSDEFPPTEKPPSEPLVKAIADVCKQNLDRCGVRMLRRVGDCAESLCNLEPELSREAIAGMLDDFGPWHELGNLRNPVPAPEWIPDKWGAFKEWKVRGSPRAKSHVAEMMEDIEKLYESYGKQTAEDKPIH